MYSHDRWSIQDAPAAPGVDRRTGDGPHESGRHSSHAYHGHTVPGGLDGRRSSGRRTPTRGPGAAALRRTRRRGAGAALRSHRSASGSPDGGHGCVRPFPAVFAGLAHETGRAGSLRPGGELSQSLQPFHGDPVPTAGRDRGEAGSLQHPGTTGDDAGRRRAAPRPSHGSLGRHRCRRARGGRRGLSLPAARRRCQPDGTHGADRRTGGPCRQLDRAERPGGGRRVSGVRPHRLGPRPGPPCRPRLPGVARRGSGRAGGASLEPGPEGQGRHHGDRETAGRRGQQPPRRSRRRPAGACVQQRPVDGDAQRRRRLPGRRQRRRQGRPRRRLADRHVQHRPDRSAAAGRDRRAGGLGDGERTVEDLLDGSGHRQDPAFQPRRGPRSRTWSPD